MIRIKVQSWFEVVAKNQFVSYIYRVNEWESLKWLGPTPLKMPSHQ